MTPLELIFTALSEETTRLFAIRDEAEGFDENYDVAQKSGNMTFRSRFLKVVERIRLSNRLTLPKSAPCQNARALPNRVSASRILPHGIRRRRIDPRLFGGRKL